MTHTRSADNLRQEIEALAHRYDLEGLYVFGSRAQEIAGRIGGRDEPATAPDADLDIGVHPARRRRFTAEDRVRLAADLEDLFGVNRVDLVVLPEADAFLALEIIRGELLYCADLDEQAEYELYVLRRAGDLAHFERVRREMILAGGAR